MSLLMRVSSTFTRDARVVLPIEGCQSKKALKFGTTWMEWAMI